MIHPTAASEPFPRSTSGVLRAWLDMPVMLIIGYVSLFCIALGNLVDLEADNDTVSISGQAFVKILFLGLGGVYGGIGFMTDVRVRQKLLSFPLMWMVLLVILYFLSVLASPMPLQSFASTISVVCVLLLTVTALIQIGVRPFLQTIFYAMSTYVILSWVAFLALPSVGVFQEVTMDAETVARMGGLAHPNTLGQVCGFTLVLGLILYRLDSKFTRMRMIILGLAAAALIASLSRTALLATVVSIAVVYRYHVFRRKYFLYAVGIGILACVGIMALSAVTDLETWVTSKLGMLSKSGDIGELTTATGRTEIWAYALHLIGERPLTGYGAATAKFYLADYSFHCHNLVLNIAFSTGIFGGLTALYMCMERGFRLFVHHHPVADALVAFILINGLFENVFSILAGVPTMIWVAGLCVPQLTEDEANQVLIAKAKREAVAFAPRADGRLPQLNRGGQA